MEGESFAAILGAAGAVREDDYRIGTCVVGIKNADVKILVALGVVEDEVGGFGDRVWAGREVVAVRGVCSGTRRCGCGEG